MNNEIVSIKYMAMYNINFLRNGIQPFSKFSIDIHPMESN